MNLKSWIKIGLLAGLGGWYIHHLYTNPKGLLHQRSLAKENAAEQARVNSLVAEVANLQTKIIALQSNRFEREKIIREDLQMSCTNEYVYLLPKEKRACEKSQALQKS
jgi:cell division protein FtsB